jgi:tRNA(adenine34) deaminase
MREAGRALDATGCPTTLYVTLEPCPMCASAMVRARSTAGVRCDGPSRRRSGSVFNIVQHPSLNHRMECTGGVLAEECGALLKDFFVARP